VIDTGNSSGDVLILAWGSTYGVIKSVVRDLVSTGHSVSHLHLTWINPFPANLSGLLRQFRTILIPEINKGQLIRLVRDKFLVDAIGYNKIQGTPFTEEELKGKIISVLSSRQFED
jgi:2-oxoglutarate ferredoxin oxidoreductase subunit alpha